MHVHGAMRVAAYGQREAERISTDQLPMIPGPGLFFSMLIGTAWFSRRPCIRDELSSRWDAGQAPVRRLTLCETENSDKFSEHVCHRPRKPVHQSRVCRTFPPHTLCEGATHRILPPVILKWVFETGCASRQDKRPFLKDFCKGLLKDFCCGGVVCEAVRVCVQDLRLYFFFMDSVKGEPCSRTCAC